MKTQDLNIKTLTVQIKVLSVNQKKMTLSVFNQIIIEPLFLLNGNLRGDVFGFVNKDGLWLIWVNEKNELRKTALRELDINRSTDTGWSANLIFSRINKLVLGSFDFTTFYEHNVVDEDSFQKAISPASALIKNYQKFYEDIMAGNNQLFISI